LFHSWLHPFQLFPSHSLWYASSHCRTSRISFLLRKLRFGSPSGCLGSFPMALAIFRPGHSLFHSWLHPFALPSIPSSMPRHIAVPPGPCSYFRSKTSGSLCLIFSPAPQTYWTPSGAFLDYSLVHSYLSLLFFCFPSTPIWFIVIVFHYAPTCSHLIRSLIRSFPHHVCPYLLLYLTSLRLLSRLIHGSSDCSIRYNEQYMVVALS
jgi:hypothetical protein